jgi:hypothetical protein
MKLLRDSKSKIRLVDSHGWPTISPSPSLPRMSVTFKNQPRSEILVRTGR